MKRNATPDPEAATLPPSQTVVLAALLAGQTITEAANDGGVDRTTVHRWLRADWDFIAALNRGRRELQDAVQAQLLRVAERAAYTVSQAVEAGDIRAALAVLKGLGLLDGKSIPIDPDDPEVLSRQAEAAGLEVELSAREAEHDRLMRSIIAG